MKGNHKFEAYEILREAFTKEREAKAKQEPPAKWNVTGGAGITVDSTKDGVSIGRISE